MRESSVIGARRIALRTGVAGVVAALIGTTVVQACGVPGLGGHEAAKRRAGTGAISVAAAPVGQTRTGKAGVTPGLVTFKPARPGRVVLIQGKIGARWKTVSKTVQDARGQVSFTVSNPSLAYRALAPATKKDRQVVTKGVTSANWGAPTWRDEFSGRGALDPAVWTTWPTNRNDAKLSCSDMLPQNATREGGVAVLKVTRLPGAKGKKTKKCPHGQFGNAIVQADNPEHLLAYGFAAARVKFSPARGQHSAFWLDVPQSTPTDTPNYYTGAEIDVAEYFGDKRPNGGLASFVHRVSPTGKVTSVGGEFKSRHLLPRKKEWSQGWHVYSVEWSPSGYIFRVDGKVTFKTSKNVSKIGEKVVLSALTSTWEIPALNVKQLPNVTKYDWVRVWQRPS
ncbi:glycoside hydrolase family 16 protein [Nocardioides hankookensis]|uniref:Family 16 glycosylhydrolase n=1 Tax=Nocardioides hankookensis TaxID=443157 RepID=A0ABW1LG04_9ACTN